MSSLKFQNRQFRVVGTGKWMAYIFLPTLRPVVIYTNMRLRKLYNSCFKQNFVLLDSTFPVRSERPTLRCLQLEHLFAIHCVSNIMDEWLQVKFFSQFSGYLEERWVSFDKIRHLFKFRICISYFSYNFTIK